MTRSARFFTALVLFCSGLVLLTGCQSKTPEETVQKTEKAVPTKTEPVPEKETVQKTEPAKTARKVSPKNETKLPPVPPSTQELAAEEVKKRGGTANANRNGDIVEVIWNGPEVGDDDLVVLQKFPFLSKLDLTDTSITDEGLKYLRSLEYLRHLYLLGTGITDAGVAELQGHSRLERLCLDGTLVTDKGVQHLEPLNRMVMLHLASRGEITDACIASLLQFKDLREIKLEGTKVTEDGKARLAKANPEIQFIGVAEEGIVPEEAPME